VNFWGITLFCDAVTKELGDITATRAPDVQLPSPIHLFGIIPTLTFESMGFSHAVVLALSVSSCAAFAPVTRWAGGALRQSSTTVAAADGDSEGAAL